MSETSSTTFPLPKWVTRTPYVKREQQRQLFIVRLASLYFDGAATTSGLSAAIGYNRITLNASIMQSGKMSVPQALKIEQLLGRELFPRELLRPDLFLIPES